MIESRKLFAAAALLSVVLAGVCMQMSAFRIYGVAPNLILVCLIVCSFFTENIAFYALLVLIASWSIRTTPVLLDALGVATAIVAIAVFWLQRRIVVKGLVGVSLLVGAATIAFYAIIQPSFIGQHFGIVFAELIYNLFFAFLIFEIIERFFGKGVRQ